MKQDRSGESSRSPSNPNTKSLQPLVLVKERLDSFDLDWMMDGLLEFLLDNAGQCLVVRLKISVMRKNFGPQAVNLFISGLRFLRDLVADIEGERFVVKDLSGGKKYEEEDGTDH